VGDHSHAGMVRRVSPNPFYVWCPQRASTDYLLLVRFCSTIQSSYSSTIQKRQFTSVIPMNVDEETMQQVDDGTPCYTLVSRYLYDYASLLLEFHNTMLSATDSDDTTRYAIVVRFDGELRAVGVEKVPKVLSPRESMNPAWPKWTKWARESLQSK
jgi:hypothetical protein